MLTQVNLLCGGTHAGHVALWDDRSPSSPCRLTGTYCNLLCGGTHAGHVALWDDRSPSSPCRLTRTYCNNLPRTATLNFAYITLFFGWYTVKKDFSIFPFPAGMSLTKLSLGGNNNVIYKLFPSSESLVSNIPAGEGNIE